MADPTYSHLVVSNFSYQILLLTQGKKKYKSQIKISFCVKQKKVPKTKLCEKVSYAPQVNPSGINKIRFSVASSDRKK